MVKIVKKKNDWKLHDKLKFPKLWNYAEAVVKKIWFVNRAEYLPQDLTIEKKKIHHSQNAFHLFVLNIIFGVGVGGLGLVRWII